MRVFLRVLLAFLIAPLVTPLVMFVGIVAQEPKMSGVSAGLVVGLFSLIFAYGATLVLGLPTFLALRESRIGIAESAICGAGIGFLVFAAYFALVHPAARGLQLAMFFAQSTIAGAGSAALFFRIARPGAG